MQRRREIFFITFIQICIVLCIRNYTINNTRQDVTEKCIVDILSSKTQFRSLLVSINNEALSNDLLRQIHSLNNVKVCVKDYNVFIKVTPSSYLIHGQNLTKFEDLIDSLDKDWYRQPEALFIIVMEDKNEYDPEEVFRILWEYHLIHALVIIRDRDDDASIYTYYPYAEGQCGRGYSNIIKLRDCKNVGEFDVVEKLREYDKPVLSKCTLNVATRNYPPLVMCDPELDNSVAIGIERFLVELLLERENISLNYTCLLETEDVGNISDNFTVTGVMEKLYENHVDLLFGGFSVNNRRAEFFDFLCLHLAYEDMYVAATPRADLIERWKMVYIMFHTNVWLLLLLILVLCAIILSDFRNLWIIRNYNDNVSELFNLIGNATQNLTLVLRERLFKNFVIVHWLWFIFLINCFYQTGLTSFTTHRSYKPQLDQYHSLEGYNFTPCMPWDIVLFLKHSGQVPIINEKYLQQGNCETAEVALDEVAHSQDKYTVTMYLQYLWWYTKHGKENRRIHLMKENFYNNLYALFFKRGFPLLRAFNIKMLRLPEHGFVHGAKDFHRIPRNIRSEGYTYIQTALKLDDLTVPFGILIAGLVFALLVFILEVLHKYNMNNSGHDLD